MADVVAATGNRPKYSNRFQPGNPGRLPGTPNRVAAFEKALRRVETERGKTPQPCTCTIRYGQKTPCVTLNEHYVRMTFYDPEILTSAQKKLIPDLQHQTGETPPTAINIHYGHLGARVQVTQPLAEVPPA